MALTEEGLSNLLHSIAFAILEAQPWQFAKCLGNRISSTFSRNGNFANQSIARIGACLSSIKGFRTCMLL